MDAKLTLKLDEEVIAQAKEYAKTQKRSLSRIIEAYLKAISSREEGGANIEISPFVKSMISESKIPSDLDYKKEYQEYLTEKYK